MEEGTEPMLLLTEERETQPVSNVCSEEAQCMRNRQSRQDGGRGNVRLVSFSCFTMQTFATSKAGEGGEEADTLAGRPTPFFNKEICLPPFIDDTYYLS